MAAPAGLLVAGTLRRPVIEPYTDPMTNRDRAQTLLVTGSDFNMERGVGARVRGVGPQAYHAQRHLRGRGLRGVVERKAARPDERIDARHDGRDDAARH